MNVLVPLRRCLIAALLLSLYACSYPQQQAGSNTPGGPRPPQTPQVAQALGTEAPPSPSTQEVLSPSPQASQPPMVEAKRRSEATKLEQRATKESDAVADTFNGMLGRQRAVAPAVAGASPLMEPSDELSLKPQDTERYQHIEENAIRLVAEQPLSTFSIDVDTGAYANVRRFLTAGQLPPKDAVRIEELINYFSYGYAPPAQGSHPFAVHTEVAPSPWNPHTHLLRVALKGQDVAKSAMPSANLVFLIDVSGSMSDANKLPLLKTAFKALARELRPQDRVSLVVYAGASGVVLEPTPGNDQERILGALDRLTAGGSTHGAAGIELAYAVAQRGYIAGGINRVLLATDGDFNVGVTSFERLKDLVEHKRRSGVSLSTLGFGTGNYNEHMMEQLADAGNGNYSYIDTLNEGRKVLIEEFTSTLTTIAKDVKIQIEFNPATVAEYRLIGYENRALRREDFNNDKVDAGEIGAGHAVTALYEIRLAGQPGSLVEPPRYRSAPASTASADELAMLRIRYKAPDGDASQLMQRPIRQQDIRSALQETGDDFRFAASVAAFGQLLRGGRHLAKASGTQTHDEACGGGRHGNGDRDRALSMTCAPAVSDFGYDDVLRLAKGTRSPDRFGYRAEFLELVATARRLSVPGERAHLSHSAQ